MSALSGFGKAMLTFTGLNGGLVLVILIEPFGLGADQLFTRNCKSQPSDQLISMINLTDEASLDGPTFEHLDVISGRVTEIADAVEHDGRPIVLWVHGFRTSSETAACVGGRLKEAFEALPPAEPPTETSADDALEPQIITFSWPSDFENHQFSQARHHATEAAGHLARLLDSIETGSVTLVAHSLGGQVALEALQASDRVRSDPIAQLVLVQAAVPHSSIRFWEGERRVHHPVALDGAQLEPVTNSIVGAGCYVSALSRAERVTVTSTRADSVLSGVFATSTNVRQPCFGPMTQGNQDNMDSAPGSHALGLPFRAPQGGCLPIPAHNLVFDEPDNTKPFDDILGRSEWPMTMMEQAGFTEGSGSVCTDIEFRLPRDDIDFFNLGPHRFMILGYAHNPLLHSRLRNAIVARISAPQPR